MLGAQAVQAIERGQERVVPNRDRVCDLLDAFEPAQIGEVAPHDREPARDALDVFEHSHVGRGLNDDIALVDMRTGRADHAADITTVRNAVFVGVERVIEARAHIIAVGNAVTVGVGVGNAATADTCCDLVGIADAAVVAVGGTVGIGVGVRDAATADAHCDLVGIADAAVVAVCGTSAWSRCPRRRNRRCPLRSCWDR